MRDCVSENTLIRLVGSELTAADREQVMGHLQTCAKCRQVWNELRATWDVLGQIADTPPEADLTGRVLAGAAVLRTRRGRWASAARFAAVLALAGGLGITAGLLVPASSPGDRATEPVSDEQVVKALGLDAMDASTDLLTRVFETDRSGPESGQEQPS